ncbi:MAG: hypothetical protein ACTSSJ_04110 [Candidatus Odinarchaeia archaeon]
MVGASTFLGGGIEAVVISGMICANDICNWELRRYERTLHFASQSFNPGYV